MASGSTARTRVRAAAAATDWWTPIAPDARAAEDSYRHGRGWVLAVAYTEHGEIASASVGRWEPTGKPSEKLTRVLSVLTDVK